VCCGCQNHPVPSLDPVDDFAEVLTRRFLTLCENPRTRDRMVALVQGASGSAKGGRRLYALINRVVVHPLTSRTSLPDSSIRWELATSQLVGIATLRYVVRLEPMASLPVEDVVRLAAPGVAAVLRRPTARAEEVSERTGRRIVIPVPRLGSR